MMVVEHHSIIPAPAGIQNQKTLRVWPWTPACAGELKVAAR
jgi:hypothetical protein